LLLVKEIKPHKARNVFYTSGIPHYELLKKFTCRVAVLGFLLKFSGTSYAIPQILITFKSGAPLRGKQYL